MYQLYHANQKAHITPTNTTLSFSNSEVVFKVAKSLLADVFYSEDGKKMACFKHCKQYIVHATKS